MFIAFICVVIFVVGFFVIRAFSDNPETRLVTPSAMHRFGSNIDPSPKHVAAQGIYVVDVRFALKECDLHKARRTIKYQCELHPTALRLTEKAIENFANRLSSQLYTQAQKKELERDLTAKFQDVGLTFQSISVRIRDHDISDLFGLKSP